MRRTGAEARALLDALETDDTMAKHQALVNLRLAASDLAATVEALEVELAEARLCLLAEAGDPRGAEGLRRSWGWYLGRWQLVDGDADLAFLRRTRVGGATDPYGLRWSKDGGATLHAVPAGLTIREAMRWVQREVGL